jgi:hypothetical protein
VVIPDGFPDAEAMADAQERAAKAGVALNLPREAERFRNHALGIDRRLRDWRAGWRNWIDGGIDKAPKAPTPLFALVAAAPKFPGPPELRAAIAADPQLGEGFAASYIDRAGWDEEERALIAANDFAASKLDREAGHVLRRFDVGLFTAETPAGRTA